MKVPESLSLNVTICGIFMPPTTKKVKGFGLSMKCMIYA